ncbi:MAG: HlyC/CorC family transporter [Acidobacteria bacterium]|nr:HlyC/CorC family transporter [Acidobacteriota bacterium]
MTYSYRAFLLVVFVLPAVNALFVAAEVALISVRRSRLRALAADGNLGAQAALSLLANPGRLLSVVQIGVTATTLAMGQTGEKMLSSMLLGLARPFLPEQALVWAEWTSAAVATLLLTLVLLVVGELVPKSLGLERAERVSVVLAPVMLVAARVFAPLIFVVERGAAMVNRTLGLRGEGVEGVHSAEELKHIVEASRNAGQIGPLEARALEHVLELDEVQARQIMVPRHAMVSVAVDARLDEVLRLFAEQKHSRIPVYRGSPERIVGILHYREVLEYWHEHREAMESRRLPRPFRLDLLARKPLVVPETKPVTDLIEQFRTSHTHMALVVDEFGSISGLVTLEDALEQVFGEIEDEHDPVRTEPVLGAGTLDLDGATPIRDLDTRYGIELPGGAGFETLAGFVLFQVGTIPREGDSFDYEGRRFTVARRERNRVALVRIERLE